MTECPICFDDITDKTVIIMKPCGHFFCYDCIRDWNDKGNQTCPLCREVTLSPMDRSNHEEVVRDDPIVNRMSAVICLISTVFFCLVY